MMMWTKICAKLPRYNWVSIQKFDWKGRGQGLIQSKYVGFIPPIFFRLQSRALLLHHLSRFTF